jgi:methyltransferase-like protein
LGEFDYVLIADAYSRLAAPQQDALLATCRRLLAQQGVAALGCQVLPGAALAVAVDQLLADQPAAEAERGAFLRYLMRRNAEEEPQHLRQNRALLLQPLAHTPGYFHEFARAASRHGLHCLGEASDLQESLDDILRYGWPGQAGYYLREQYRDFLLHRSFRYNLLCRRPLEVSREALTQRLRRLHFSSPFQAHSEIPPIQFDMALRFFDPQGGEISEDAPIAKSALWYLGKSWPRPAHFDDLLQQARQQLEAFGSPPEESDFELLAARLLRHYMANRIHAFSATPLFALSLPDFPSAAPLARLQAGQGQTRLCNLRHEIVELRPVAANLLLQLDGSRDRADLLKLLQGWVRDGWLCPRTSEGELIEVTPDMLVELLDNLLNELLQQGLLLGE